MVQKIREMGFLQVDHRNPSTARSRNPFSFAPRVARFAKAVCAVVAPRVEQISNEMNSERSHKPMKIAVPAPSDKPPGEL
jgi:hypothetical protein